MHFSCMVFIFKLCEIITIANCKTVCEYAAVGELPTGILISKRLIAHEEVQGWA